MSGLENKVEFRRWLDQCVVDAQDRDRLGLDLRDIIVVLAEKLKELVIEYGQRR